MTPSPWQKPGATSRPVSATHSQSLSQKAASPLSATTMSLPGPTSPHLRLGAIGPAGQQLGARAAFGHQAGRAFHPLKDPHRAAAADLRRGRHEHVACLEGSGHARARHRSQRAFVKALSILRQQLQQAACRLHLPPLPITSRLGQAIDAPLFRLEILIDMGRYPGGGVIETAVRPRHRQHR